MSDEIYFVYVKLRPNGEPCYVGAACNKYRPRWHDRLNVRHPNKHLAAVYKEAGVKVLPTQIVLENLTRAAAERVEKQLIAKIGRISTGPLCNRNVGGGSRTPEGNARHAARLKARWKDPDYYARRAAPLSPEELRERRAEYMRLRRKRKRVAKRNFK